MTQQATQQAAGTDVISDAQSAPRYVHDCDRCHYLGRYLHGTREADLYVCMGRRSRTVIARFGDDGPDYLSGEYSSYGQDECLTEARRRAQVQGVWDYNPLTAMLYVNKDDPQSVQELMSALPFTLEYQAFLALEQGKLERHEFLLRHLHSFELAQQRKSYPSASELTSLLNVEQRIIRVVSALRNLSRRDLTANPAFNFIVSVLEPEVTLKDRLAKKRLRASSAPTQELSS